MKVRLKEIRPGVFYIQYKAGLIPWWRTVTEGNSLGNWKREIVGLRYAKDLAEQYRDNYYLMKTYPRFLNI